MVDRRSASEAIFQSLRDGIETGRLQVGTRLPSEAALAEQFGVSRTVVREALRSTGTLGLTATRTGSGTHVISSTVAPDLAYGSYSARDLLEARPLIEIPAAALAAARRSDVHLATLADLCDRMETERDPGAWVRLDSEFHCAIAVASGNAVFAHIVNDAREALARQSQLVGAVTSQVRMAESNREHRIIDEAISAGNPAAAEDAMRDHLERVERIIRSLITDSP